MIPRELLDLRRSIAQLIELLGTPPRRWEAVSAPEAPGAGAGISLAVAGPCDVAGAYFMTGTSAYLYDLESVPPLASLPPQPKLVAAFAMAAGGAPVRFRRGVVVHWINAETWSIIYRRLTREEIEADQRTLDSGQ